MLDSKHHHQFVLQVSDAYFPKAMCGLVSLEVRLVPLDLFMLHILLVGRVGGF